jgi:hypothetical protein
MTIGILTSSHEFSVLFVPGLKNKVATRVATFPNMPELGQRRYPWSRESLQPVEEDSVDCNAREQGENVT